MGRETRQIPASQFGRVRALTRYGMTRAQVAELHGVIVDEIEKIIRRSDQPRKSLDPLISARTQLPVLDSASDAVDVLELGCLPCLDTASYPGPVNSMRSKPLPNGSAILAIRPYSRILMSRSSEAPKEIS